MSGPGAPVSKALLWCGWRVLPIDILLDPTHDLSDATRQALLHEQLQEADCIMAALDCSTKSRAREIPLHFSDGRPSPKPLRSNEHPEGLPGLNPQDVARVERDNRAPALSWKRSRPWCSAEAPPSGRTLAEAFIGSYPRRRG